MIAGRVRDSIGHHRYKADSLWYLSASPSKKSVQRFKAKVGNLLALKEALSEANDYFLSENGTRAVTTYGASTALAKQIEGGMPGDLFFAGDVASMNYLAERNLIKPGTRKDLLRNRLVLIAPATSMLALTVGPNFPLADAIGSGQLAIADPVSTPAGKYTQASLEYLGYGRR